jgi:hypothetical protein
MNVKEQWRMFRTRQFMVHWSRNTKKKNESNSFFCQNTTLTVDDSPWFFFSQTTALCFVKPFPPSPLSQDTHPEKDNRENHSIEKRCECTHLYPSVPLGIDCARQRSLSVLFLSRKIGRRGRARVTFCLCFVELQQRGFALHHFWSILCILEYTQLAFTPCRSKKESEDSNIAVLYAMPSACSATILLFHSISFLHLIRLMWERNAVRSD